MKTKTDFPDINSRKPDGIGPDGNPYKILVVDDSMFVKKQLTQILGSESYEVVDTAGHGAEAVEKYKELYPGVDLVTMDITMPGMDGVTALEKIMEFDKDARIIMISALGKQDLVKKVFYVGSEKLYHKAIGSKEGA